MGFTALVCLLSAFTLTTQDLVSLIVSPTVTAECGQQVTLNCNVSSYQHGLTIKHMEWSQGKTHLCTVDSLGELTQHNTNSLGDFHCNYEDGRLSLTFPYVQPLNSGKYRCKLRSTEGAPYEYTTVELKECSGEVESVFTSDGPSCIFHRVYPDGDVHWFHGHHNLSDRSMPPDTFTDTSKSVDEEGYLTIYSQLKRKGPYLPYNCSLKSTRSGRYIASTLVKIELYDIDRTRPLNSSSGVRSQEPMRTILGILILLAAIMK